MRPPTMDPTAGETAREIHTHPGVPRPIADPTDPRYGELPLGTGRHSSGSRAMPGQTPRPTMLPRRFGRRRTKAG